MPYLNFMYIIFYAKEMFVSKAKYKFTLKPFLCKYMSKNISELQNPKIMSDIIWDSIKTKQEQNIIFWMEFLCALASVES